MQISYGSIKRPAGVERDPRRPPGPAAAAKDDGPCRAVPGGANWPRASTSTYPTP
ncbi:hypothetical protein GCM10010343_55000 [Streptomyces avidinii]|nr:hypothetical protein GCM10010343_55000 [Streptomyces avidinii]